MKIIANGLILALVALAILIGVGTVIVTPTPTGYGVSVDSHWSEVRAIEEKQRTERTRLETEARVAIIAEQEATARLLWPVVAICVTVAIVGVAWSKRPHRPMPPQLLLTYMASHYLPGQAAIEQVDGEWFVVDHEAQAIIKADRLIGIDR